MKWRIEFYRPYNNDSDVFRRWSADEDVVPRDHFVRGMLHGAQPGTFALVIHVDGEEETLERWRVDRDGRVLRAVYDVRERELEQT